MKIQRDGKEYTLTAEEVMEAHEEFVTSFMAAELENSYDVIKIFERSRKRGI